MSQKPDTSLNFLERVVGTVAPGWALSHAIGRAQLNHFESRGANDGRLRGDSGGMNKNGSPESHRANKDRIKTMWDARDMEDNSPLIAGILERTTMYTVGNLSYKSKTGDGAVDDHYERFFGEWAKNCDVTGRFSLREMISIAFRSMLRDGDYGIAFVDVGKGIKLQGIEADRIGSPLDSRQDEKHVGGLDLDDFGQVINYQIFKRSRTNQYTKDRDCSPNHFIHLNKVTRSDRYRCKSWLAAGLPHARDLHEIFGFEKQGAKFASMWAAFIRAKDHTGRGGWDTEDKKGLKIKEAVPGLITELETDQSIEFAPGVQRPSGAFMNLVESVIRNIAIGLNLPYGFVYNMAAFGGVTARLETQQAQRVFETWQRLLIDKVLDRIRDQVIGWGIATRQIPAHPNWRKGDWRFGAAITADVQHQTSSDIMLIDKGLKTRSQWCQEHGLDFEEVQEECAREMNIMRDVSARNEMPVELLHEGKPNATEMLAAMSARDDPPPEPKGMIEEYGAQGMKPLLDVLEQVGDGSMDRESAIATLMDLYGIEYHKASMMVPQEPRLTQGSVVGPPLIG
jgi:lambda family phage portal protein